MALPDPRDPVALARALIACPSVTPEEGGALRLLSEVLESLGFTVHRLEFGSAGRPSIVNLYARRGTEGPNLCFAGHTDVVPPGDAAAWSAPPFGAEIRDGSLVGRGAVDMKGAIAAFVAAAARTGEVPGSISLLITGDEEGDAVDGTVRVVDWLEARGERIDACIVGEPTNQAVLGDMIKIGRRGSLTGRLTVHGTQGHAAYPHLADNPIPPLLRILSALDREVLDDGAPGFDASNLEITSVDVGNPASNVIPATARAIFNVRFNVRHSGASLTDRLRSIVAAALDRPDRRADLDIHVSGEPFLTEGSAITDALAAAVAEVTGRTPALSTTGGTSDARFIKRIAPVVEFGLVGQTMHKIDEQVPLADLARLTDIYMAVLARFPAERPR